MSTKKPRVVDRRFSQAVEVFEKAMKAVGKREFERAQQLLDEVIADYPEERDVVERARTYRALCERSLEKRPAARPKGFDELLHFGVYLHNRGEFEEALKYFQQAADVHPKNEHVLYCLAAASSRAGDTATAVKSLRSAILANPASRAQAKSDSDFDPIREDEEFAALLDAVEA